MKSKLIAVALVTVLLSIVLGNIFACTPTPTVQYDLTISSTAGGSVIEPGEGTFTYDEGTMVYLVADPYSGYEFVQWTGDVDDIAKTQDDATTITMNGNYIITAEFAAKNTNVLRVGLARDLDGGPLGVFDCYGAGPVYRWFHDKVNDEGGLYLSGYNLTMPLELIIRDFDVLTWDLAYVTEVLIDRD